MESAAAITLRTEGILEGTDYEGDVDFMTQNAEILQIEVGCKADQCVLDLDGGEKTKKLISLERCQLKITRIRSKFSRIILSGKTAKMAP